MGIQHVAVSGRGARVAFIIAASAGLLHAAASLYWALGGRWQLESVGEWAVHLADEHPVGAGLGLGALAALKAAAAVAPALNETRKTRLHGFIRLCGWAGAAVLIIWGALSMVSAWAVLAGAITPTGGYNRATMIGHAAVWDPLFVVWGVALIAGLRMTMSPNRVL